MAKESSTGASDGFKTLGLDPRLLESLLALGYEEPTPIQREAIPHLVAGKDMVGQAATGTGKTAAFALPLLQRLAERGDDRKGPSALVLVPTRELAMQVSEAIHRYGRPLGANVLPVYGGQPLGLQLRGLKRGVDVVVGTPGRILDHIRRGTLDLKHLSTVVLDEADEMLDMGFAEDIEAILGGTPEGRQTVLFSATLPARIAAIAKRHLTDPVRIQLGREPLAKGEVPRVRQTAYLVSRPNKLAALGRVLDIENPVATLVFCRTRNEVDELAETLTARGHRAEALHGGMDQTQRTRVIKKLKTGAADLVVATDVAARGLDIEQLSHVVNFNVPSAPEAYVHRIGRVGRAGREGVAITLAEPREHRMLRNIEHATKQKFEMAQVPSHADLRARRMELTRAAVRETLLEDQFDGFRAVVESLADEYDVMDIALAAVKLAHQASGMEAGEAEEDIPPVAASRDDRGRPGGAGGRHGGTRDKARKDQGAPGGRARDMVRLFIGLGRHAGIRPQDLVGAIAGEAKIDGGEVGGIEIADRFSIVEVPEGRAELVIKALRASDIRGRRVTVRRDRHED
jgi:ATP-dependent RNA helicase DeaD